MIISFSMVIHCNSWESTMRTKHFCASTTTESGRGFGSRKMHLGSLWLWLLSGSKAVVLLLLIRCWLFLPLWDSVVVLCFVVRCFVPIPVLLSSWSRREGWLHYFVCLPGVSWLLCGSSSRWHGVVCSLWLRYFLIILTYFLCPSGSTNILMGMLYFLVADGIMWLFIIVPSVW